MFFRGIAKARLSWEPLLLRQEDTDHAASEKGYKGFGMEGFTAKWYTSLTRKSAERGLLTNGSHFDEVPAEAGGFNVETIGAIQLTHSGSKRPKTA